MADLSASHEKYLEKRDALEAEVLPQFKEYLKEQGVGYNPDRHTDVTLLRFLRARKHKIPEAFAMFQETMKWRADYQVDTILENPMERNKNFDRLRAYWPAEFVGEDNDGVPVYYERIATVDPKTLLKAVTAEDLIHYHVYCQEEAAIQLNDLSKKLQKPIFGNTVVEDMEGLGWKHYHNQALAILKQIIAIDEANYPEILKRYYLINAPRFFQVLWAVVKPWLDPRTLAKIRITSGVPAKELSKDVPMDQIPEVYGGTLKVTWKNPGGLFESSNEDGTNDTPVMEAVGRRDSLQLPIVVDEPNQTILWDFTVKAYDISFSIAYESTAKEKREVVLKPAKVSGEQKGEHTCEKAGTYYVIFDNTYSWTRGKEITYTLRKDDAPPADVDPETLKLMDLEIKK